MATTNPFDLLVDDDHEDPSQLIAAQQPKVAPVKKPSASAFASAAVVSSQSAKPAKLPSKPLPPAMAVREAKTEAGRESGRGGGRGSGRGVGRGRFGRDLANNENQFGNSSGFSGVSKPTEDRDNEKPSERQGHGGPRGLFRGGRHGGGSSNGEAGDGERPRRVYERHSGTGRGNEFKREGAGRGNWGSPADEIAPVGGEHAIEDEKNTGEKQLEEDETVDVSKENQVNESEEKEPVDKEMTLEEYEKVLEEKRKALMSLKTEERKVDADKEFESMQQLSSKKGNDDIFIKLGSEKDKRKDLSEKEDKAKKPVSITNILKPADGERYYSPSGRGRGRGRGSRAGFGTSAPATTRPAPSIEDPGQFPSLGAK